MELPHAVGKSVPRKEALEKATGSAVYTNDRAFPGMLHARLACSPFAHARLASVDIAAALNAPGVRAVVTSDDVPFLTGSPLEDRPPLARGKVRYFGEPVAIVVAEREHEAQSAAALIRIAYEPLPVVLSPSAALQHGAPLVHEAAASYRREREVYPEAGTNIANRTRIRKGNMDAGWSESDVVVESRVSLPQSDHAAMETRCVHAQMKPEGKIIIHSSSQAPYAIRKLISKHFAVDPGKVVVHTPLVGGAFGGKSPVQLEFLAVLATQAVGGTPVALVNSREQDMVASPVHIGLESNVKLGCTRDGKLKAAEIVHLFDGGAYSDRGVIMSRAAAVDCTGPYRIDNVSCDSLCMYTNHPYATSFRGFSHPELTFAVERAMDLLAEKLAMDPLELRFLNAIGPGDTTPTQTPLTRSTVGDLPQCIDRLRQLTRWDEGQRVQLDPRRVRAIGACCLWKTSSTPVDAGAGAIVMFAPDGGVQLICGAVEIGQGTRTALAQMLAERLKMETGRISIEMEVDTSSAPEHWKTVASRSTFLVGNAVLAAADDVIGQLRAAAADVLGVPPEELEVGGERVYVRHRPESGLPIRELAHGYRHEGVATGKPIIGRGSYMMQHLTELDPATGKGDPGPEWTVGAQAVEVELDTRDFTYRIIRAYTVLDAGTIINPMAARGQVTGAMSIGMSMAGRETFVLNAEGAVLNSQLRTYPMHRYGDQPEYVVDFVETPHLEAPYGLRGIGEHGLIGMPAALASALSRAVGVHLYRLPLLPEQIWRQVKELRNDSL